MIVRLLALTAQRRGEIVGMQWSELELSGEMPTWTIPGSRTKNKRTHVVPLTPAVVSVIQSIPRTSSPFLFPARGKPDQAYSGNSKGNRAIDAVAELHVIWWRRGRLQSVWVSSGNEGGTRYLGRARAPARNLTAVTECSRSVPHSGYGHSSPGSSTVRQYPGAYTGPEHESAHHIA
jgi:Phage integrase family